jgi:hypothetical protein
MKEKMSIDNKANPSETAAMLVSDHALADELNSIGLGCAQRPIQSNLTADQILGYDEFGAPTR